MMRNSRSYREEAWTLLSQNYWSMFLLFLFYTLVAGAASYMTGPDFSIFDILMLLLIPLDFGYTWCVLDFSRQKEISVKDIVEPYLTLNTFLKTIAVSLVMTIFLILWTLLLIIPGIIKSFSYAMVPYILKDQPDVKVLDAITQSRKLMDGNKWRLFKLMFSFIGWILLIPLTLGFAIFWVGPYLEIAISRFYDDIKEKYMRDQEFYQNF